MLPFSLFRSRPRTPAELVKALRDSVARLDAAEPKQAERATEDCRRHLAALRSIAENEGSPEVLAQLAQEAYNCGLLELVVESLGRFEFEARKDAVIVFNNLVRRQIGTRTPTVEYICSHAEMLKQLLRGYDRQDLALNYGLMLRECLRHETLAQMMLNAPEFYVLFDHVQLPTFDIASDAFATLKDLLSRHKMLVASFLIAKYDEFIPRFNGLLQSENYVTRRQSLKLLGEILLDRANFDVMTRYISNAEHLKLLMNLLRDRSRNIQLEAFHVFKIFVANPNKNKPVYDILLKNQRKLVDYLDTFQTGKDDEQFAEEKRFLVQQIEDLAPQQRDSHFQMS